LAGNQLSGTLPTELRQLTQIKTLILSNNSALSWPVHLDRLDLFHLEEFQASNTHMNGTFEQLLFSGLPQLTTFKLDSNGTWTFYIQQVIFSGLPNLTIFEVEGASLRGTLPEELALWNSSLTRLWLQNNQLTGRLPTALNVLTQLQELRLEGNQLSGTISQSLCDRRGQGYQKLEVLTVDCSVACTCCDDYDEKCA
jgi:Leucine-rich repeat (LRR) protein